MNEAIMVDLTIKAMTLVLLLSMPAILVASLVGICVGLFQAVTQIQDQTLPFAIKLAAVITTLIFTAQWCSAQLLQFGLNLVNDFPRMVP